jgi:hypothetical protein
MRAATAVRAAPLLACPGPDRGQALACLLAVLVASSFAPHSYGGALLDVSGSVVRDTPRLEVSVRVTNRGDRRASGPIDVIGELFGEERRGAVAFGLEPGAATAVTLEFEAPPPRPGLHALALVLEHPLEGLPDAAGNPPVASQRAFVLLALGARPDEAVRLAVEPLRLGVRGSLRVRLESRDGAAHRVRLRALTARGLRPDGGPLDVAVPAQTSATAVLPIVRAGAPRGGRQALLVVAETADGPLARTSVVAATVDVQADPALMPRLRVLLLAAGLGLVALALALELRSRLRSRPHSRAGSA